MSPEERAYAAADVDPAPMPEPTRRLSPWRVLAVVVLMIAAAGAVVGFRTADKPAAPVAVAQSAFMPYVDVTATPEYAFEAVPAGTSSNLVLGFVVGSPKDGCSPSWGAAYSLDDAASALDLDRRIARARQLGGEVTVSFGGQANSELATACTDPAKLLAAYRTVVERYQVHTIDLDIEGAAASAPQVSQRRATAIAALQRQAGKGLQVWLTLPVDPGGLTSTGRQVVRDMLNAGVDVAGVNALTMDYGASLPTGQSLVAGSEAALTALAGQLRSAYAEHGQRLSSAQIWQRVGATPMIGQNDVPAERFGLDDARELVGFAQRQHMRRLSMWSLNRDQDCGPNYANVAVVSDNCSGVAQQLHAFSKIFATFRSRATGTAGATEVASTPPNSQVPQSPASIVDDPATSPYPIWNPDLPYSAGTKIVWHRNVYQAKWWTQGDTPDAPVTSASDTPWQLIGPVLPGDHPKPTPTVSAGTYPEWSATKTYRAGDRVVYEGFGYQAKWYTRGDVPGVVVSDPGQTPWKPITGS